MASALALGDESVSDITKQIVDLNVKEPFAKEESKKETTDTASMRINEIGPSAGQGTSGSSLGEVDAITHGSETELTPLETASHKTFDNVFYNMTHTRRGKVVIINNKNFEKKTGMNIRTGTDVDASNLVNSFQRLGFETDQHDDLSVRKMLAVMKLVSRDDFSDCDCVAFVILSHGDDGIVYGTDGKLEIDEITKFFQADKCPTLAGKPKLFFIQACRGDKFDDGAILLKNDEADEMDGGRQQLILVSADFLLVYSTVPGFYSWRNPINGSWFIQALCQVLNEYGDTLDILRLMTRVNQMVAYEFESSTTKNFMNQKKQIPCIVSMLTKDLYFTKKPQ
uniref:Caspase-7-like n=1 Tax=Saccoglossus kowalevskii TaxID=10224 RepID=A0ABM0GWK4_SACKO|nr:PREDICTED: caspase-7-like [Saccoglossus kowalevskii]